MKEATLRAWWAHRQGLDGGLSGQSAGTVLARTGWARSVGGVGPYLTLFSRGGLSREASDAALDAGEIHELPSARGCTYVLPKTDFALGLKIGQPFHEPEMNVARKLGVTDAEIEKLCAAVLSALRKDSLDPEQIRDAVGPAARNLGEAGKKKGMITTLPVALGRLQGLGEIRRIPVNGRLDQQRYKYSRWSPNPLAKFKASYEECCTELARRFFAWIGPATLGEFQWFSGLSQKTCRAAIEPLNLVPLEAGSERLLHEPDLEDLMTFECPRKPHYSLVSTVDGISMLRRDLKSLFADGDLESASAFGPPGRASGGLTDLPCHAILDRGRVVGLWEFDPAAGRILWTSFATPDAAMKKAVAATEVFIRDEVGDARSFTLDSPKAREPKLKALRDVQKANPKTASSA